jgi:hypothetical protein
VLLTPGQAFCLPVTELRDRAVRQGWVVDSWIAPASPHAPPGWRSVSLHRGGLKVSTNLSDSHACVEDLYLWQPGDPPIQPITPEEQAAIRRSNSN